MNFPFGTNGKFIVLGVPILKHITVSTSGFAITCFIYSLIRTPYFNSFDPDMAFSRQIFILVSKGGLNKFNQTCHQNSVSIYIVP